MTMSYAPAPPRSRSSGRVRLNVGGRIFETTADTLASAGRDTMLGAMVDASWNPGLDPSATPEYFIDRDPTSFALGMMMTSGKSFKAREEEETCYPKLAVHGGRLFASMNDAISVFSGPDHVHTSTLRGSGSGICDFSVGGDRLFVLHNDENVFDVWETPPPPII
ncbi:hypothetical protein PR202_ga01280 [Eleusine coracana subsp. coracana]|uniref:Potassium channel tetramerisation-type BTB domain-containing protein n=1 Tax=Eleusine coracana subsp. coracana TaxID=191504 RepID=A0AAV5BIJ1_ELECO|nr:hypothetical protein PR202_ga01280 [Eleusine coracana subsp. coracana]